MVEPIGIEPTTS